MKKSLVLAMAMAMGVTASAYAANPFSDVPAGHWAYDSISKLATAGVVDGYGTTFGGEKLMTRYEMAQIVAKAMAKGANVEKLAAEFADELDALGVRVAALEKKVDNVKISGQIRFTYQDDHGRGNKGYNTKMRNRIFVEGAVNDNWTYTGMLQQTRNFDHNAAKTDDSVKLIRAYLDGRLGGLKIRAGHWNEFFINEAILDNMIDGVQASYGLFKNKVNVYGLAGKFASDAEGANLRGKLEDKVGSLGTAGKEYDYGYQDDARLYILGAAGKLGEVNLAFNYFKTTGTFGLDDFKDHQVGLKRNIYNVNASWSFLKDFTLKYDYMWADKHLVAMAADSEKPGSKDGWIAQLFYKGSDPAKPGTWGLHARYFDQPSSVFLFPTYDLNCFDGAGGYEGWNFGGDVTLAKNIFLNVNYYDTESKGKDNGKKEKDRRIFSELYFLF